jgi:acetyl-CoA C-acetyltransferase
MNVVDLGVHVADAVLKDSKVDPTKVGEIFLGSVYLANAGQNPARQIGLRTGMINAISTNVGLVCLSGLKAVALGAQSLRSEPSKKLAICLGSESMSNVPYYLSNHRFGKHFGEDKLEDGMLKDGLMCSWTYQHMIATTEGYMGDFYPSITQETIDRAAIRSHLLAKNESFENEISPIEMTRRGRTIVLSRDEGLIENPEEVLSKQRPVFFQLPPDVRGFCDDPEKGCYLPKIKNPKLKVGSCSKLSDGAAAVLLATESACHEYQLEPIAEILEYQEIVTRPDYYIRSIDLAVGALLEKTQKRASEIDLYELNEAFACVIPIFQLNYDVPETRINISGGAVALGHPLGCSGARLLVTLIHNLLRTDKSTGIVSLCSGGGIGGAMMIRRCDR